LERRGRFTERHARKLSIAGRSERPIEIPWREVRHRNSPYSLTGGIERSQRLSLRCRHTKARTIIDDSVAVGVDGRHSGVDAHNLDDPPVRRGDPGGPIA